MNWQIALLSVVILANLIVSALILRNDDISPGQQRIQLCLTWLLPIVGAVVCYAVTRSFRAVATPTGKVEPLRYPNDGGGQGADD